MVSVCKQRRPGSMTEKSTLAFIRKNVIIALTLAILFGLGWGFGLAASGTPSEETTFILQLLFTIFVGCQGILIFVLHGVRKAEARDEWKKWFSTLTCRQSDGEVIKSPSTLPLSQNARSQVTSPSTSVYNMSTLTDAEKGEIPPKAEDAEFNGANEQGALHKQSLIQAVADVMNIHEKHAEYDVLKASESPPPQIKMNGERGKDDSEEQNEVCVPFKQHTRRVSAPEPHSSSSEFKQARKHRMSSLTPNTGKYDLTSLDSLPPICNESISMSLLECEEEEEERQKGVKEEDKVRPQPHETTTKTAADSHASATAKD